MVITLWLFNIAMENPPVFNRENIYFYGPWLPWLCSTLVNHQIVQLLVSSTFCESSLLVSQKTSPIRFKRLVRLDYHPNYSDPSQLFFYQNSCHNPSYWWFILLPIPRSLWQKFRQKCGEKNQGVDIVPSIANMVLCGVI